MKHAYLILAHNEFAVLERLIQAIDDERNDIYIHFDGKLKSYPVFQPIHAGLFILTERIDVRWGDISVVKAEYALFEAAFQSGGYSYYHLLSGVDMPLKSQDYIHRFFVENNGKEFIGYYQEDITAGIDRKVRRWHLFPENFKDTQGGMSIGRKILRAGWIRMQLLLRIRRNKDVNFRKGTQWLSISSELVGYLLQQREAVMRIYSHTFCSDEIFVQTICWNSPFRNRVYNIHDEGRGCLRMIGWKGNRLEEWQERDFEKLMSSDALFARKFGSRHIGVVNRILNEIVK